MAGDSVVRGGLRGGLPGCANSAELEKGEKGRGLIEQRLFSSLQAVQQKPAQWQG